MRTIAALVFALALAAQSPAARFVGQQSGVVTDDEFAAVAERCLNRARQLDPDNPAWARALVAIHVTRAAASHDSSLRLMELKAAANLANTDELRMSVLPTLATSEFEAGETTAAERDAKELLDWANANLAEWNHDDRYHAAQTVLGRVALERKDLKQANDRLLASGRLKGSPALNSFGPSMQLAQELLEAGERDAVIQYLELTRAFWTNARGRVDGYLALIKTSATPNLLFPYSGAPLLAGAKAPSFKLKDLTGKDWTLERLAGKAVALDFWATWCGPCLEELPILEKLSKELPNVVILAVNVGEPEPVVHSFVEKHRVSLPVLLAGDNEMLLGYHIEAYPTLAVVDHWVF